MFKSKKLLLFIFGTLLCLAFALYANSSFRTLSLNHNFNKLQVNKKILKKEKIFGEFKAGENGLGIITVRFNTFNRLNHDLLIFRIREKNSKHWYYENRFNTINFYNYFGFPKIENSKNRVYYFEIESTKGSLQNSLAVDGREPNFKSFYQVSKKEFIYRKLPNSLLKTQFVPILILFYLPFLFEIFRPFF